MDAMSADVRTRTPHSIVHPDRYFFTGMSLVALAIVFIGFASSYYLWPLTRATHFANGLPIPTPLPFIVHLHAVIFTAWILLFVVQTSLVAADRTATHRRLGLAAAWLVPVLAATGLMTAVQGGRDGWAPAPVFVDALSFMIVPITDIVVFTVLVGAALAFRGRPQVHKRLMLLAVLGGLTWPAITRMPIIAGHFLQMFAVFLAVVLAPAIRDFWTRSRYRWLSLWVALGQIATVPARSAIGNTESWRAVAAWLVG